MWNVIILHGVGERKTSNWCEKDGKTHWLRCQKLTANGLSTTGSPNGLSSKFDIVSYFSLSHTHFALTKICTENHLSGFTVTSVALSLFAAIVCGLCALRAFLFYFLWRVFFFALARFVLRFKLNYKKYINITHLIRFFVTSSTGEWQLTYDTYTPSPHFIQRKISRR